VFQFFERLVQPYPEAEPTPPPKRFLPFLWACTRGLRPYMAAMTLCTAVIGAFEALLFAFLGRIVDWLAATTPARLWADQGHNFMLLAAVLGGSIVLVGLQSLLKQQALAGNMPMLLRWNFHRLMLAQSMNFYQDEFAGRISTKVMQTALAVRDAWMILAELMVFVVIYFVTLLAVLGGFDRWLLAPFTGWLLLYAGAIWYFVPRLGTVAKAQASPTPTRTSRPSSCSRTRAARRVSRARRCRNFWRRCRRRCGWSRGSRSSTTPSAWR
jgi:ATP-binding cassette, subfamily B, multidrug efflux pump